MKYSLVVNRITNNIDDNVKRILEYIDESKNNGAEFVLFPECAITGLQNNDIEEHDLKLGINERSKYIRLICRCALKNEVFVSIGFLELDGAVLYDSVICIDNTGNITAKYRRISDGWHGYDANKNVYMHGKTITTFFINNLKYSWLICGDLFDDALVEKIKSENVDILIFPFARTMDNRQEVSQKRWDIEEMPSYIEQIIKAGATTLMNNYITTSSNTEEYFFGGAYVVNKHGKVLSKKEVGNEGLLFFVNENYLFKNLLI